MNAVKGYLFPILEFSRLLDGLNAGFGRTLMYAYRLAGGGIMDGCPLILHKTRKLRLLLFGGTILTEPRSSAVKRNIVARQNLFGRFWTAAWGSGMRRQSTSSISTIQQATEKRIPPPSKACNGKAWVDLGVADFLCSSSFVQSSWAWQQQEPDSNYPIPVPAIGRFRWESRRCSALLAVLLALGASGMKASKIVLNCAMYESPDWLNWVQDEEESISWEIKVAYDAEINVFDTANTRYVHIILFVYFSQILHRYSNGQSEVLRKAIEEDNFFARQNGSIDQGLYSVSCDMNKCIDGRVTAYIDSTGYMNQYGLSRKAFEAQFSATSNTHPYSSISSIQQKKKKRAQSIYATSFTVMDLTRQFQSMKRDKNEMFPMLNYFGVASVPCSRCLMMIESLEVPKPAQCNYQQVARGVMPFPFSLTQLAQGGGDS
ncbi:hypothetical protein EDD18DRAFT_1326398 [Armillaria luteobubalina]|uniref:Uncharacterized protein n=1 Tax=Armillaria luteobubalina TaxID=153913 RepID=A0AA39QP94_9AGAR|nr:hypothetical protein EDD18DRAFT_1326398 [Armillaria luteobubalina]